MEKTLTPRNNRGDIYQGISWANRAGRRAGPGPADLKFVVGRAGPGREFRKCGGPGRAGPSVLKILMGRVGPDREFENLVGGPGWAAARHVTI